MFPERRKKKHFFKNCHRVFQRARLLLSVYKILISVRFETVIQRKGLYTRECVCVYNSCKTIVRQIFTNFVDTNITVLLEKRHLELRCLLFGGGPVVRDII